MFPTCIEATLTVTLNGSIVGSLSLVYETATCCGGLPPQEGEVQVRTKWAVLTWQPGEAHVEKKQLNLRISIN